MRFYFIRHGQSENNLLWEETGSNKGRSEDPELTKAGHEQAQRLAQYIFEKDRLSSGERNSEVSRDTFQFTHLYTSLMVRSVKTAYTLSEALDMPLQAWPEIHECGGIYLDKEDQQLGLPGKSRTYFANQYQKLALPNTVTDSGWYNRPFEVKSDRAVRARLVLDTLIEKHGNTDHSVAIVSHGGFYMEIIRHLFNISNDQCWFLMHNTAVSRFDISNEGQVSLIYHNRTDHLPIHLIT